MRLLFIFTFFVALIVQLFAAPTSYLSDPEFQEQMIGRLYRSYLLNNQKRSPSIGLSLAEYMASGGQGQDNFHFIPSGR